VLTPVTVVSRPGAPKGLVAGEFSGPRADA
jgi:hypothetical protein